VLADLLGDEARLERCHAASLDWWERRCSERALGTFMARTLDAAHLTEHSPLAP